MIDTSTRRQRLGQNIFELTRGAWDSNISFFKVLYLLPDKEVVLVLDPLQPKSLPDQLFILSFFPYLNATVQGSLTEQRRPDQKDRLHVHGYSFFSLSLLQGLFQAKKTPFKVILILICRSESFTSLSKERILLLQLITNLNQSCLYTKSQWRIWLANSFFKTGMGGHAWSKDPQVMHAIYW